MKHFLLSADCSLHSEPDFRGEKWNTDEQRRTRGGWSASSLGAQHPFSSEVLTPGTVHGVPCASEGRSAASLQVFPAINGSKEMSLDSQAL